MKYRKHKGYMISEVGIGCYALSGVYGKKNVKEFKQMLYSAYELGVNFFDTAEAYGDAEHILGEVIKPFREEVYIATKVHPKEGGKPTLSGAYVKNACLQSLERLQTDYIDLYQVHFDDPKTNIDETVGSLEDLMSEGKIHQYGICHLPSERIEAYCKAGKIFSVQMELSAVVRDAREQLLPLCRKYGVGAIAFSTTGRGLLTGRFQRGAMFQKGDIRNIDPLFQRERFQSGLRVTDKLIKLSHQYGKKPAQTAIAWVLAQPGIICALTGPSSVQHLEENVGGSGWTFSSEDLDELETFFKNEEAWLKKEQLASLRHILTDPLPHEVLKAFRDLIYVIETAILLDLISEVEVLPLVQELFAMRKALNDTASSQLVSIRKQLRDLIQTKTEEIL